MEPTALLPLQRKACWGFFHSKNPTASAGCEPANLGTKGQHATSRPPKPLKHRVQFTHIYIYIYIYIYTYEEVHVIDFVELDRCVTRIWCHFAGLVPKPVASSFSHSLEYLDTVAANSETPATHLRSPSPVRMSPKSDTLDQLTLEEEKALASGKSWCSKTVFVFSYLRWSYEAGSLNVGCWGRYLGLRGRL